MRDKKHKVKKVKCKRNESTAKELIFLEYNNIYSSEEEAFEFCSKLCYNRPGETRLQG